MQLLIISSNERTSNPFIRVHSGTISSGPFIFKDVRFLQGKLFWIALASDNVSIHLEQTYQKSMECHLLNAEIGQI
jgi:hypothetical protein